jgi:F0F1-type ATP synthase delta subunit
MASSLKHQKYAKQLLKLSFDEDAKLSFPRVEALVQSLASKPPLERKAILGSYLKLLRRALDKETCLIEYAGSLSPQQLQAFESFFSKHYHTKIALQPILNTSLIGGIKVSIGSDIWEHTILNNLNQWIQHANS